MNPTLPETPPQQQQEIIPPSPTPIRSKKRVITAIALIVGPPTLMILTLLAYAVMNFVFGSTSTDIFDEPSTFETVTNIILFLVGAITILATLPCFIIGIILLTSRKKS